MNMNPANYKFYSRLGTEDSPEELQDLSTHHFVLKLNRDELSCLNYPVIVENWEKCVGPYASGSKKRKFRTEFTEPERKLLSKYNQRFYRWYLVTGPPPYFLFGKVKTVGLIQRAANFFATV